LRHHNIKKHPFKVPQPRDSYRKHDRSSLDSSLDSSLLAECEIKIDVDKIADDRYGCLGAPDSPRIFFSISQNVKENNVCNNSVETATHAQSAYLRPPLSPIHHKSHSPFLQPGSSSNYRYSPNTASRQSKKINWPVIPLSESERYISPSYKGYLSSNLQTHQPQQFPTSNIELAPTPYNISTTLPSQNLLNSNESISPSATPPTFSSAEDSASNSSNRHHRHHRRRYRHHRENH
jgi:hypothetical protein